MPLLTDNLDFGCKLDGNSNDAIGSNNGTDTGITYSAGNGKIVQGAGFVRASVSEITFAGTISVGANATISCWMKSTDTSAAKQVLFRMRSGNIQFALQMNNNKINAYTEDSNHDSVLTLSSVATVNDGNWHHCVFVRRATNNYYLYVDGLLVDSGTTVQTGNMNSITPWIGGPAADYYEGAVDECWYWSRDLSASEVSNLYFGNNGRAYPFRVSDFLAMIK